MFRLIPKNEYEKILMHRIMSSYGLKYYYGSQKRENKYSFRIKCTQDTYDLIISDFKYYNYHLSLVLKASVFKFGNEHIKVYEEKQEEEQQKEYTKEELEILELMMGMDSISNMKLSKNKSLTNNNK